MADGQQNGAAPAPNARAAPPPLRYLIEYERPITKFRGSDPAALDGFIVEVKRAWRSIPDAEVERKIDVLTCNLGPEVQSWLSCVPHATRNNPDLLLEQLKEEYGEKRQPLQLLQLVLQMRPLSGESVKTYSHRLKGAWDTLVNRQLQLAEVPYAESTLRDHFINTLPDPRHRRDLRDIIVADPAKTFLDVRSQAIRWDDSADPFLDAATAAVQIRSEKLPNYGESSRHPSQYGESSRHPAPNTDPMITLMTQLIGKMDQLLDQKETHRPSSGNRDARGRPVCFKCRKPGHFKRDCPGN